MSNALRRELPHHMDVADFLDWLGDGEGGKYELVDGELRAMAPASATHGAIQANLAFTLKQHLRSTRSPCRVIAEPAIVPRVSAAFNLRVPDLGVTCAPDQPGQIAVTEPVLLIEVLSPGNARDTRANIWAYTTIPSLREILLVHSARIRAELLRRAEDGTWPERAAEIGPAGIVGLASIGFAAPLAEFYDGTHLAVPPTE